MIEVQNLTKRFGNFTAVDGVSFSVGKGVIFGFLGPNGSGKYTVVRLLRGILEPSGRKVITSGNHLALTQAVKKAKEVKGFR